MCDQGRERMGRGWSRPTEGRLEILFWAKTEQANTNCLTSWPMEGHQNRWRMAASDLLTPGWQVTLDSWPHWRTSGQQRLRHEQPTRRTLNWHFYPSSGPFHTLLDVPGESPYHYSFREYGISRGLFSWALELAGMCIGLSIFGPGPGTKGWSRNDQRRVPSEPGVSSASWPNGYILSSYDPSRPRRVALTPPTSDATHPRPT